MRLPTLLLLLPLAATAADERVCTLKLAWWDAPATIPGPTLTLGSDGEHRGFSPEVMNFGIEARNVGDIANFLVKRTTRDPKTGKETVEWTPFATVPLPRGDDTLGVVLITDAAGQHGGGRAFSLGPTSFPLGSIRLVNLAEHELMLGIEGKVVRVPAGSTATHPRTFAKPEVAEIGVAALVNGQPEPVFSTKSEFSDRYRLALFVVEIPGSQPPRFEVRTILDYPQPQPTPKVNGAPPANGTNGAKPQGAKTGR